MARLEPRGLLKDPLLKEPPRAPWVTPLILCAVVGGVVAWKVATSPSEPEPPPEPPDGIPEREKDTALSPIPALKAPPPPRCSALSAEPFIVGDTTAPPRASASADAPPAPKPAGSEDNPLGDPLPAAPEEPEDPLAPFAIEIGKGAVYDGGFAAAARRDSGKGAVAMIATLGFDGKGGRLVKLGRSRGDLDPPAITGAGDSVLAALLEPDASGRAIKIAKVTGETVTWGPSFTEGHDDSLAVDIASSGARAVVAWDDVVGTADARSRVVVGSFDVATLKSVVASHAITDDKRDAGSPRLVSKPGGYWLGYVVKGIDDGKKKGKEPLRDEYGEGRGEEITTSWVEVMPLDESGAPAGAPRAVTPAKGHVLGYDLELGADGGLVVVWRDDDTPSGSSGGRINLGFLKPGGSFDSRLLVEEGGAGVPDLLPGWVSVAASSGATKLAAVSPTGQLVDELSGEPTLGAGEPIAATKDAILWARPLGKSMRLNIVRCTPRPSAPEPAAPASDAGK